MVARADAFHQGSSTSLLALVFASIKSQKSGGRLPWDLDGPMVSVMAIESKVSSDCVEEIGLPIG